MKGEGNLEDASPKSEDVPLIDKGSPLAGSVESLGAMRAINISPADIRRQQEQEQEQCDLQSSSGCPKTTMTSTHWETGISNAAAPSQMLTLPTRHSVTQRLPQSSILLGILDVRIYQSILNGSL